MKKYDPSKIEKKWQSVWAKSGIYKADDKSKKPKFYVLDMFPYPSGEGLHVGHVEGYTASDITARFMKMRGYNVLHPMGWDAFGLPAENYAIKMKIHPAKVVAKNVGRFKKQLNSLGLGYDWSREINTTDPGYYKWTQWIFLQLYNKGLAYEAEAPINWCPSCKTGLANEEVVDGRCDRCGTQTEKKNIRQWVLKITDYAEKLLEDIDSLDWPEKVRSMQKHWIGRSEGSEIDFVIEGSNEKISVFTTRPDTLFGATYVVLAPEHPLVEKLKTKITNFESVQKYVHAASQRSEIDRTAEEKEKTGVELRGVMAINPTNSENIPVWIADYVLATYGTGAIMAVPAHDQRDFDFAKKFDLPIIEVISPSGQLSELASAYEGAGVLVQSGKFNGVSNDKAKKEITEFVRGKIKVHYKLRDWIFSRQRYWGEPIPLIKCEKCGVVPVPESDLPVKLPNVKHYEPTGTGESPLAGIESWVKTKCPNCGGPAKRETNTMPQWAGSCWYYLRYIDPKNKKAFVDKNKEKYWSPVDLYIGGVEHAVLHLLYSRFWHKVLYDLGFVSTKEPFKKLINQGLIQGPDGQKMSKSRGNVINPDAVVAQYGSDALRMYEMFMGPLEASKPWDTNGIVGVFRFLSRFYQLAQRVSGIKISAKNFSDRSLEALTHKTIKKTTADYSVFAFNTAISSFMVFLNELEKSETEENKNDIALCFEKFLLLLGPMAPHLCEEIWQMQGHKKSIFLESWPSYDEALTVDSEVEYVIQVNGKHRDTIKADKNITEQEITKLALDREKIKGYTSESQIKKIIFVKGRLLNIVV
jgi:leucyl-tRNA synthetase